MEQSGNSFSMVIMLLLNAKILKDDKSLLGNKLKLLKWSLSLNISRKFTKNIKFLVPKTPNRYQQVLFCNYGSLAYIQIWSPKASNPEEIVFKFIVTIPTVSAWEIIIFIIMEQENYFRVWSSFQVVPVLVISNKDWQWAL